MFVVDDDEQIRDLVVQLMRNVGYSVRAYAAADEFLANHPEPAGVLIVELRLKGPSGLLLQHMLQGRAAVQIIFMSGVAEVEDAVSAMKAGAFEFLVKPFRPQALIDAVGGAFEQLRTGRINQILIEEARQAYHSLTDTEREMANWLASGLRNKEVAYRSGRAESTVKVHRARIMKKMAVNSLVDLAKKLQSIGLG